MQIVNGNLFWEVKIHFFFVLVWVNFIDFKMERDGVRERESKRNFTCKNVFEFVLYYLPKFYQIIAIFTSEWERLSEFLEITFLSIMI